MQERRELDRLWHQRLERAAYEAGRAARHYRLIESVNVNELVTFSLF